MTDAVRKTAWTPGPWRVNRVGPYEEYWVTNDHYDAGPARIVMKEADARLIAAAPELYEALERTNGLVAEAAMTGFNFHDGNWAERLFENQATISNALRKARGES